MIMALSVIGVSNDRAYHSVRACVCPVLKSSHLETNSSGISATLIMPSRTILMMIYAC